MMLAMISAPTLQQHVTSNLVLIATTATQRVPGRKFKGMGAKVVLPFFVHFLLHNFGPEFGARYLPSIQNPKPDTSNPRSRNPVTSFSLHAVKLAPGASNSWDDLECHRGSVRCPDLEFWVQDSGFRVGGQNSGFRVQGLVEGISNLGYNLEPSIGTNYKTASAEIMTDEGGVSLLGSDQRGNFKALHGRVTNVHRALASGARVAASHHMALGKARSEAIRRPEKSSRPSCGSSRKALWYPHAGQGRERHLDFRILDSGTLGHGGSVQ